MDITGSTKIITILLFSKLLHNITWRIACWAENRGYYRIWNFFQWKTNYPFERVMSLFNLPEETYNHKKNITGFCRDYWTDLIFDFFEGKFPLKRILDEIKMARIKIYLAAKGTFGAKP